MHSHKLNTPTLARVQYACINLQTSCYVQMGLGIYVQVTTNLSSSCTDTHESTHIDTQVLLSTFLRHTLFPYFNFSATDTSI